VAKKKSLMNKASSARSGGSRSHNAPKAPLYDKKQANRISLWIVVVIAALLGGYVAIESSVDPVSVADGRLRVRALFGFSVALGDISELRLEKEGIVTRERIFGNDAFGFFREGDFMVDGLGKTRVFLKKPNLSYVSVVAGESNYAISLGSLAKDQKLYDEIKASLK
jgi:hypothetical protein